jgi:type VI secretion system protein ImpL
VGLAALGLALLVLAIRFGPALWQWAASARSRAAPSLADAAAARRVGDLRERWKVLTGELKGSRLGARAFDSLPWYVLLGESGSGKSSALRNCGRGVALGAGPPTKQAGQESRLGWALLDGAVVLDTPGPYTAQADEADRAEWAELLTLLSRTRGHVALDGAVVAVAADTLLRSGAEELKAAAGLVRRRLDEAIRRTGVRFPVYVLVTRWDKVEGMSRFFECLPPKAWEQPVGGVSPPDGPAPAVFTEEIVDRLAARLGDLRLTLLADPRLREVQRAVLLFPEETRALRAPLASYVGALCAPDPYRESAPLRGVYFASAHQEGKAVPGLLARLGFPEEELPAPAEDRSLFLSGFFGDVVPRDRGLAAPTSRALTLRSLTENLGLTAWVAACLLFGVVATVSFTRNLSVLREVSREVPSRADLTGRLEADLVAVDRLRAAAERLRQRNAGWGLGRVLLPQARRAEESLWAEHDRRFRTAVLDPLDRSFNERMERLLAAASPEEMAAAVDLLVKRVNLLGKASAVARAPEDLARLEQPSYAWFLGAPNPGTLALFQRNYLAHLARGPEGAALSPELAAQRERLNRLLGRQGAALDWVVDWANLQQTLDPVRLGDFWGAAQTTGAGDAVVGAAYTPAGWAKIQEFLGQMATAFAEGSSFARSRGQFEASYRKGYLAQWERFLVAFPQGETAWPGRDRSVELAVRLGGRESPYARLLAVLPEALKPAVDLGSGGGDLPGWVLLSYRCDRLRQPAYQEVLKRSQGAPGSVAAKGTAVLEKIWQKLDGAAGQDATLAEDSRAFPFWTAYQDALAKSAERVRSSQAALQLGRDVFLEADLAVGEPQQPVSRLYWTVKGLQRSLGRGSAGEDVFFQLLTRQADQLWAVILTQAEVEIQRAWEADVLAATVSLPPRDKGLAVWGQGGKAWDFLKGSAAPFLTRAVRPTPKTLSGGSVRFSRGFLDGLAAGPIPPPPPPTPSRIQISALPTDANAEATAKPHMTRLLLQCNSGGQELVNQNYPVSKTFVWSAEDCADAVLEIGVGNTVLRRVYGGPDGFARFLGDFRGGRRVFRAADFPDQKSALAGYRLESVTVSYTIRGSLPSGPPIRVVPDRIVP